MQITKYWMSGCVLEKYRGTIDLVVMLYNILIDGHLLGKVYLKCLIKLIQLPEQFLNPLVYYN